MQHLASNPAELDWDVLVVNRLSMFLTVTTKLNCGSFAVAVLVKQ